MSDRSGTNDPLGRMISRQRASRAFLLVLLLYIVFRMSADGGAIARGSGVLRDTFARARQQQALMSAPDLEMVLRNAPAGRRPLTDPRCVPGEGGWHYVCAYQVDPAQAWSRVKIGVQVDGTRIRRRSAPHPIGTPLPPS